MEIDGTLRSNCLKSPGDDKEEEDYNDSFGLLGTHGVVGTLHPILSEQQPVEDG